MIHCSIGSQSYADIYETCTGFSIRNYAYLPTKICSSCEKTLISFHEFRLNTERIEERLQVYQSLHDSENNEQQSGTHEADEVEDNLKEAEPLYEEVDMYIEAIDEELSVMDEESISCSISEIEVNQDTKTCCFIPLEPNRKEVSCKFHATDCKLQMKINIMKPDQAIPITCECGATLKNRRSFLKHHSTVHASTSSRIKCKCCNETFTTWRSKMSHEANLHSIGLKYECSSCGKKFYRSDHWKEHAKTCNRVESSDKFFACSVCLFTFQREETYKKHLMTAHVGANEGDAEYANRAEAYAQKYSKRKGSSDEGKQNSTKDETICTICKKSFKNEVSLSKHTSLFHSNHVWPCENCSAVFIHRSTKISHMSKEHGAKKPFQCASEGCDFSCFKRDRFTAHMDKHVNPEKKFPCPICQQEFKSYNTMTLHRARHLTKNTFICLTCGKQFLDKRNYNVHMKLHTGEDLHHCPTCDRGFNRKDHLQKHQQSKNHFTINKLQDVQQ